MRRLLSILLLFTLSPALARAEPTETDYTAADYAAHVKKLRARLPSDEFTIVVAKPFVVIGDASPKRVRARAEGTVAWAVRHLKARYFDRDPRHILDIWLFKNKASYEKHAEALFGEKPSTPYGYYSARHRALVMNIATGGGTLVHEIVHPFMEANFPACPAWFNEGLASLYEQSQERDGQIRGMTNWRLAGLQRTIRAGRLPSFKTLAATSAHEFYREDPGTNYAQVRYLLYYLQERGLLQPYYQRFVAHQRKDPTGYKTLQAVLGEDDMAAFQKRWEKYVLGLKFP
jgi:hypothetical protein